MSLRELVILTADRDQEQAMTGLFARRDRLGCAALPGPTVLVHPQHDPGCLRRPDELLRPYLRRRPYALVILDHEGSGDEGTAAEALEQDIEDTLVRNGWARDEIAALVIEPEVESWIWMRSPLLVEMYDWRGPDGVNGIYGWLVTEGWLKGNAHKPFRPKEARAALLRANRIPRSSSDFRKLAERARLDGCEDRAFLKLQATLRRWYGGA